MSNAFKLMALMSAFALPGTVSSLSAMELSKMNIEASSIDIEQRTRTTTTSNMQLDDVQREILKVEREEEDKVRNIIDKLKITQKTEIDTIVHEHRGSIEIKNTFIKNLESELKDVTSENARLNDRIKEDNIALNDLASKNKALTIRSSDQAKDIDELRKKSQTLTDEKEELIATNAVLTFKNKSILSEVHAQKLLIKSLEETLTNYELKINTFVDNTTTQLIEQQNRLVPLLMPNNAKILEELSAFKELSTNNAIKIVKSEEEITEVTTPPVELSDSVIAYNGDSINEKEKNKPLLHRIDIFHVFHPKSHK